MKNLAHLGFNSQNTFGRALPAELDRDRSLYFMDPFLLDTVKIQNSKAFRRLRGKTQVISSPNNVNIRDRMIHSLGVSSIAIQSGARLALNIFLLQSGSLSHDLGHVPLGHLGEKFIAKMLGEDFRHERFVIFVLEMIERDGLGLNLSYETLSADLNHSRGTGKMVTSNSGVLEDDVIMLSDKFDYIPSDYNDILRIGYNGFTATDEMMRLGKNQTERLNTCLHAFWKESIKRDGIYFDDSDEARRFKTIRDSMFNDVYLQMDKSEDRKFMEEVLKRVYNYFFIYFGENKRAAALTLALMSEQDVYALNMLLGCYENNIVEEKLYDKKDFSIAELLPKIPSWAELDFCDPSRFMDKQNFGKVSKLELFAR